MPFAPRPISSLRPAEFMRPTLPSLALVLVAALVCAGIALLVGDPPASEGLAAPLIDAAEAREIEELPAAPALRSDERKTAAESGVEAAAEKEQVTGLAPEPAVSDGHRVRGTLVLIDTEELELPATDGRFEVLSRFDDEEVRIEVEVTGGRFTFRLPDPELCIVSAVFLADGRRAALVADHGGDLLRGPLADLRLEVLARPMAEVILVVVDAATNAHLSEIEVRQAFDLEDLGAVHPGPEEAFASVLLDLSSPIRLAAVDPDWATATTCWVHAPGYAWSDVQVDHLRGGEYLVALEPGGSLRLEVVGLVPGILGGAEAMLRLRKGEAQAPAVEAALWRERILHWEGLPAGAMRATLEIGSWWDDVKTLGSTDLEVVAGKRTDAVLEITSDLSHPGRVRCSGTVRVGPSWRASGFGLQFNALGETEAWVRRSPSIPMEELVADGTDPDLFHWETVLAAAGTWQLSFGTTALHVDFEATPPETGGVELVVPDPAELRMSVRDALTGEVLPALGLYWKYVEASPHASIVWTPTEYDAESGVHSLVVPAGRIALDIWADGYAQLEEETIDLPPGITERSWTLEANAGGLQFSFVDGETATPANLLEWEVEVEALDNEGDMATISMDTIFFSAPGRYRIRFWGVEGFRPVELEAEVPVKGRDRVLVTLERE